MSSCSLGLHLPMIIINHPLCCKVQSKPVTDAPKKFPAEWLNFGEISRRISQERPKLLLIFALHVGLVWTDPISL